MYAKHGKIVHADLRMHLAPIAWKSSTTTQLESYLEVIQGHAFWITEKPSRDCVSLY